MKLHLILEDNESLLLEEAFENGIISEDIGDIIDTSTEVVFGTVGLIPGLGEPADFAMATKCLLQKDYLGAACFTISMIPDVGDAIGKPIRMLHKAARHTGKEKEINAAIAWLFKHTPGGVLTTYAMKLFNMVKDKVLTGAPEKAQEAQKSDDKKVKAAGTKMSKIVQFMSKNFDKMEAALTAFTEKLDQKHKQLAGPAGGLDEMPPKFVDDLAGGIDETYRGMLNSDPQTALKYKRMVKNNAKRRGKGSAHHTAYNKVFYDQITEV